MEDTQSSSSRVLDFTRTQSQSQSRFSREQRQKIGVYNEVLHRLKHLNVAETNLPGFEDELWAHFRRLPVRYAVDVNAERAQDVLMHKRLLSMAHNPSIRHAIEVRLVQVQVYSTSGGNCSSSLHSNFQREVDAQCSDYPSKHREMHEITISTYDKPKLLSQIMLLYDVMVDSIGDIYLYTELPKVYSLSSSLYDIGLKIQEAHAFSTIDGYFLAVFVVDGFALEETE